MTILNPTKLDGIKVSNYFNLVSSLSQKFPWQALRDGFWRWAEASYEAWKVSGMGNHVL